MSNQIVLWNAKEAKEHCEEFVQSYAKMRNDLLDHYNHKGHVALRYSDDWAGFFSYCKERLKLDSNERTIRLQISTAQVSREVGVEVPMVISRQLVKLPPEKVKEVYDEVIGARQQAGQRSANQMEPDVRRVVRRVMGVPEPEPAPPVSVTDTGGVTGFASTVFPQDEMPIVSGVLIETPGEVPRILIRETEAVISPERIMLCVFYAAYRDNNQEALLALFSKVGAYLAAN